ncbi:hypothetical protein Taro_018076 [Colocasia esculenta]|uniref:Uncharacterized protein n=1 Tax=Colocasia esculenta TaxID=4460 RepID=A0A843UPV4_COLES|nr:hypothetical protein [Colocasia esculenta]
MVSWSPLPMSCSNIKALGAQAIRGIQMGVRIWNCYFEIFSTMHFMLGSFHQLFVCWTSNAVQLMINRKKNFVMRIPKVDLHGSSSRTLLWVSLYSRNCPFLSCQSPRMLVVLFWCYTCHLESLSSNNIPPLGKSPREKQVAGWKVRQRSKFLRSYSRIKKLD